ncbi:ATP-binding protein [Sporichthya polymorpha]|uniref:ATP-binding protein n=1 Tax=Sporichthya polymorpha TaxID=35751 RepID=UPI0003672CE7|nr:ATP-binding protein [Sporichthya polymorpha]
MPSGQIARWWSDRSLRSKGLLVLALPLAMFLSSALVFLFVLSEVGKSQDRVGEARRSQDQLTLLYALVLDGESGVRGYLASGDRSYLQPTERAREELPEAIAALTRDVGDDAAQAGRLQRLQSILERGYQLRPPPGGRAADGNVAQSWLEAQRASTEEFRGVLADIRNTEHRRLADRLHERDTWIERARATTVIALGVGVAGGLAATLAFTLGVSRRLERVVARTDRLREGEVPDFVDPGQDEIGVLSRRLTEVASRWQLWKAEAQAARVAAESANQAKSEFLSRMSHELRTPMNAVLGFAQLLELDLPIEHRDNVRQIRRAGVHLLDLINEVLDISRIESGQLTLSTEPVRVSDVVGEVTELMGPIAAQRGVTLRASHALSCTCHVLADRQRAKQIVLNLASNAVKYNKPGGSVELRCVVEDGTATVEVADDGIGIPEADLDRLFVPFERLAAANSEIEGTGVGLAISQRLANAMQGRIEVASTVGQGSTFRLVLPTAPAPATPAPALPAPRPGTSAVPAAPSAELTVLSVEDNPANIRLLQEIVSRRPAWRLVSAGQGQLGLDIATVDPPTLILLDLHLPDMRGEEVLRRLKTEDRTASVPVVVVSADATPGQMDRLLAAGAASYLTKPIEVSQLLGVLDRISGTAAFGEWSEI